MSLLSTSPKRETPQCGVDAVYSSLQKQKHRGRNSHTQDGSPQGSHGEVREGRVHAQSIISRLRESCRKFQLGWEETVGLSNV